MFYIDKQEQFLLLGREEKDITINIINELSQNPQKKTRAEMLKQGLKGNVTMSEEEKNSKIIKSDNKSDFD